MRRRPRAERDLLGGLAAAWLVTGLACRPAVRVGAPCTSAPAFAPFDEPRPLPRATAPDGAPADLADGVLDALLAWYQRQGRAHDLPGVGCPFAPSCSVYARAALHRYGPIALVMIVDRLIVRERESAGSYYPAVCVAHTTRLADDVP